MTQPFCIPRFFQGLNFRDVLNAFLTCFTVQSLRNGSAQSVWKLEPCSPWLSISQHNWHSTWVLSPGDGLVSRWSWPSWCRLLWHSVGVGWARETPEDRNLQIWINLVCCQLGFKRTRSSKADLIRFVFKAFTIIVNLWCRTGEDVFGEAPGCLSTYSLAPS